MFIFYAGLPHTPMQLPFSLCMNPSFSLPLLTPRGDTDSYDVDGTRLFHVRGTNEFNTRAVQVEEVASSLNSNDCFVLETPKCTYVWYGKVSAPLCCTYSHVDSVLYGQRLFQLLLSSGACHSNGFQKAWIAVGLSS